jgi:hypothetical protein
VEDGYANLSASRLSSDCKHVSSCWEIAREDAV